MNVELLMYIVKITVLVVCCVKMMIMCERGSLKYLQHVECNAFLCVALCSIQAYCLLYCGVI